MNLALVRTGNKVALLMQGTITTSPGYNHANATARYCTIDQMASAMRPSQMPHWIWD